MSLNAVEIAFKAATGFILNPELLLIDETVGFYTSSKIGSEFYSEVYRDIIIKFSYCLIDLIVNTDRSAQTILNDITYLKKSSPTFEALEKLQLEEWEIYDFSVTHEYNTKIDDLKYEASLFILDNLEPVDESEDYNSLIDNANSVAELKQQISLHKFIFANKPQALL